MSKYGTAKYGRSKYGRYDLDVPAGTPLGQNVKYRLGTINSSKVYSRSLVNDKVDFPTPGVVKVRMRCADGFWVVQQNEHIDGSVTRIRMMAKSSDGSESQWIESVVGTIKEV